MTQKHNTPEQLSLLDYLTVKQTTRLYEWPAGGLRYLLFNREENGLNKAVRKVGRKLLLNREEFDRWLERQKDK